MIPSFPIRYVVFRSLLILGAHITIFTHPVVTLWPVTPGINPHSLGFVYTVVGHGYVVSKGTSGVSALWSDLRCVLRFSSVLLFGAHI